MANQPQRSHSLHLDYLTYIGKEERNQKKVVETDSSNNLSEDRTKEERGQALGKEERNQKRVET